MGELIDKDPAKPSTSSSSHASRSSTARAEHQSHSRPQSKDRRSTPRNQSEPSYGSCVQPSPVPAEPAGLLDRSPVHCPVNPALEADVRDIRRLLKTYITRLEAKDAAARAAKEWRIVARVLDRLIFFCYIGVILVSRWSFFPSDMSLLYSTEPPTDAPPTTAAPDDDFDYERWRHVTMTSSQQAERPLHIWLSAVQRTCLTLMVFTSALIKVTVQSRVVRRRRQTVLQFHSLMKISKSLRCQSSGLSL